MIVEFRPLPLTSLAKSVARNGFVVRQQYKAGSIAGVRRDECLASRTDHVAEHISIHTSCSGLCNCHAASGNGDNPDDLLFDTVRLVVAAAFQE